MAAERYGGQSHCCVLGANSIIVIASACSRVVFSAMRINDVRKHNHSFVSVPASVVPDNWCQKRDVLRREDESKKTTLGAAK